MAVQGSVLQSLQPLTVFSAGISDTGRIGRISPRVRIARLAVSDAPEWQISLPDKVHQDVASAGWLLAAGLRLMSGKWIE